jgi:hypothetical protein
MMKIRHKQNALDRGKRRSSSYHTNPIRPPRKIHATADHVSSNHHVPSIHSTVPSSNSNHSRHVQWLYQVSHFPAMMCTCKRCEPTQTLSFPSTRLIIHRWSRDQRPCGVRRDVQPSTLTSSEPTRAPGNGPFCMRLSQKGQRPG